MFHDELWRSTKLVGFAHVLCECHVRLVRAHAFGYPVHLGHQQASHPICRFGTTDHWKPSTLRALNNQVTQAVDLAPRITLLLSSRRIGGRCTMLDLQASVTIWSRAKERIEDVVITATDFVTGGQQLLENTERWSTLPPRPPIDEDLAVLQPKLHTATLLLLARHFHAKFVTAIVEELHSLCSFCIVGNKFDSCPVLCGYSPRLCVAGVALRLFPAVMNMRLGKGLGAPSDCMLRGIFVDLEESLCRYHCHTFTQ